MRLTFFFTGFLSATLFLGVVACGGSTEGSGTGGGSTGGDSSTGGGASGGSASGGSASGGGCTVGGKTYEEGESFPSDCNTCTCTGGQIGCTLIFCQKTCGGIVGGICAEDEYCRYDDEGSCGAGDAAGTCVAIPNACTDEYAPVCGCDGVTHSNRCEAQAKGVNVASEGECAKP